MGTGEPSLSSSQPLSISSSRWLWVEVPDLLCFYVFSALLLSPFSQLTFLQFWNIGEEIWVQGNILSLPHNLSQFPRLADCGSKFQTCYFLYFFCTFVISILILSSQSTISLLFIINLEFWVWFSIINTSKEPKGRFRPFSHFRPSSQKRPWHSSMVSFLIIELVNGLNFSTKQKKGIHILDRYYYFSIST